MHFWISSHDFDKSLVDMMYPLFRVKYLDFGPNARRSQRSYARQMCLTLSPASLSVNAIIFRCHLRFSAARIHFFVC